MLFLPATSVRTVLLWYTRNRDIGARSAGYAQISLSGGERGVRCLEHRATAIICNDMGALRGRRQCPACKGRLALNDEKCAEGTWAAGWERVQRFAKKY